MATLWAAVWLASPGTADTLTVSTWNLQHISGLDRAGCRGRTQAEYDEIRRIINLVDADIWLFQEIDSKGALARIMDPSAWTFFTEKRSGEPVGTCAGSSARPTMQRTAIAVKKDLVIGQQTDLAFLDIHGNGSLRYGLSVTIAMGARAIEVINVHLKGGCASGTASDSCPVLFEQIPFLASYLSESDSNGIPLILGGDFNRHLSHPGDEAFATLSYNKRTGMAISSGLGRSRCSLKGEEPIDYILTSGTLRDAFSVDDAFEYQFTGPFTSWPSDHCPQVVRFEVK
jgi:endonuclease/exonuclease/phosphatase family metal-dependent hydrolase